MTQTILRPDAKGRVGLGALTKLLQERLAGHSISGYRAEITPEHAILLRPCIEVDAEQAATMVLGDADRDAFLEALDHPPKPNRQLRTAATRHQRQVADE